VYAHHMRSHRRQPHPAAAAAALPAAKASRHLLAEGGAAGDDEAWLDGLFGDEGGDSDDAQADAYVQKQFCGKGGCDVTCLRVGRVFRPIASNAACTVPVAAIIRLSLTRQLADAKVCSSALLCGYQILTLHTQVRSSVLGSQG
jgi:hypothetical protein